MIGGMNMLKGVKWLGGVALRIILLVVSISLLSISNISATSSFTSTLNPNKSSVRAGETFTIAIVLSGLDSNGLGSANYYVGFNDSLFTYSATSGSGVVANLVGNTVNLGFVDMTGGSSPKQNGTFVSLTFTAKSTLSTVSGSFSLSSAGTKNKNGDNITSLNSGTNVTVFVPRTDANLASLGLSSGSLSPAFNANTTNYTATLDSPNVSINATAVAGATLAGSGFKNLNYGDNNFTIIVTAEDGTTKKNYSIKITRPDNRNTDSSLKSLAVSNYSLSFSSSTTNYNIILPSNVDTFSVSGEVNNTKSSIAYYPSRSVNLNHGQTATIAITVTAENESQTTYRVVATRKDDRSSNNDLRELSVSNTDIKFNGGISYTATVENDIASINISATANDSKSTISGVGGHSLKEGSNVFRVAVTAENGSQKIYIITVIRKAKDGEALNLSNINTLKSLAIEGAALNFKSEILTYNIGVENGVDELKVVYELASDKSSSVIEGSTSLRVGVNKIRIIVTAENGDSKVYSLYIERKALRTIVENDDKKIIAEIDNKAGDPDVFVTVELSRDNKTISTEILKSLSKSKKRLIYEVVNSSNGVIYSITIDGSEFDNFNQPLNFNITFKSDYQSMLKDLIKDKNYLSINIGHNGKLPTGSMIRIFVADRFTSSETLLYLYYFNTNTNRLELKQEKIEVIDGYVNLQLDHASEYVLSDGILGVNKSQLSWIAILIGAIIGFRIIASIIAIAIIYRKKLFRRKRKY